MNWLRQLSVGYALLVSAVWPLAWLGYAATRVARVFLRHYWQQRSEKDAAMGWSLGWSWDAHWLRGLLFLVGPSIVFLLVWAATRGHRGPPT